jgi:hypothetical protein
VERRTQKSKTEVQNRKVRSRQKIEKKAKSELKAESMPKQKQKV